MNYSLLWMNHRIGARMKSITIHGLDGAVEALIRDRAAAEGMSLNRTIKALLEEALGVTPPRSGRHAADFREFLGVWSADERAAFDRAIGDFAQMDPEDWSE